MREFNHHFINGTWAPPEGDSPNIGGKSSFLVIDASTEQPIGKIPRGNKFDIDQAVSAAHQAFSTWASVPQKERSEWLQKIHAGLSARQEELAELIAQEVGTPLKLSRIVQVGLPLRVLAQFIELLEKYEPEQTLENSLIIKEPIGVVGAITPWNYPLHQVIAKIAPAIGLGCTVVLKPSEVAPLSAFILAEIIHQAGLPAGVFNLVSGEGGVVGEALASHPLVDMLSFTGSTRAGKRVSELGAQSVKRVTLELGGKSACLILEDADLARAVKACVSDCYLNSGQTCSALTRMLVPEALHDEAVSLAKQAAEKFVLGSALAPDTRLGPLVSELQRERVRELIEQGVAEGAQLVTGGAEAPTNLPHGYFVKPTVFARVAPEMTIAQQEIFGPVLCIIPYKTEDEALSIANGTIYGLAGAVWAGSSERAQAVARRLRAGQIAINGGAYNSMAPFGGYKQSGNGREYGPFGLEEFIEVKALQL